MMAAILRNSKKLSPKSKIGSAFSRASAKPSRDGMETRSRIAHQTFQRTEFRKRSRISAGVLTLTMHGASNKSRRPVKVQTLAGH